MWHERAGKEIYKRWDPNQKERRANPANLEPQRSERSGSFRIRQRIGSVNVWISCIPGKLRIPLGGTNKGNGGRDEKRKNPRNLQRRS